MLVHLRRPVDVLARSSIPSCRSLSSATAVLNSSAADYYRRLGVDRSASAEAIKAGFHAAAKRYHPDVHGDATGELFKKVNEAYSVLSEECA